MANVQSQSGIAPLNPARMRADVVTRRHLWWLLYPAGLLILAAVIARTAPSVAVDATSAALVLGFIGATAVAIERTIEVGWILVGLLRLNPAWPLAGVGANIQAAVDELDGALADLNTSVQEEMARLVQAGDRTVSQLDDVGQKLASLTAYLQQARAVASASPVQQASQIADTAAAVVAELERQYPEVRVRAAQVNQVIAGVSNFVATFKNNPGRQLLSIGVGILLGLLIAWPLGLDVVQAALGYNPSPGELPYLTVAFTGVLMGIGSNPTHEVIRALQEYKNSRKAA